MQMHSLSFDVSHTLAGSLVLISFMMLYQDRLYCSPFPSPGRPSSKTRRIFT